LKGPSDAQWCWGEHEAARLALDMMSKGVSKYHPDPLSALRQAGNRS